MNCNCPKWKYFISGIFLGAAITAAILGHWVWVSVGALPLIGGMLQRAMKRKAKETVDFSGNGKPVEPKIRFGKDIHSKHNRGD